MTKYGILGDGGKSTKRYRSDNLTRWIITHFKGFTRKCIGKTNKYVLAYVYLALTSLVQARPSILGNLASAVDTQQVFNSTFKTLINEDYSLSADTDRYRSIIEHALSKADFSVGPGIYMLQVI